MGQPVVLNIEGGGEDKSGGKPGFWRRQLGQQATRQQTVFDIIFGIAMPVLCFIFDPLVFRGNFMGGVPLLPPLQMPVYMIALIEISALIIWLSARERLGRRALGVAGVLYTGALVSLLIGIVLFPLSLLGILFAGLGLLGFTPFLTALVFWRNARRAFNLHAPRAGLGRKAASLALGLILVLSGPTALYLTTSRAAHESIRMILEGDEQQTEAAIERLRVLSHLTYADTDKIVWAYNKEQEPTRRARLADAYRRVTGKDIEARLVYLID